MFSISTLAVMLLLVAYRLRQMVVSKQQLEAMIHQHYKAEAFKVIAVHRLSTAEKIRYGIPPFVLLRMHNYAHALQIGRMNYYRQVEVMEEEGGTSSRFVELKISSKQLVGVHEFDVYRF
ncbi:MAG: hypothetical protein AAGB22_14140 [Bacteroidota bacterium]